MAEAIIKQAITKNKVMVFAKSTCPHSKKAKDALTELAVSYEVIDVDKRNDLDALMDELAKMTGARTVPRVFINGKFVGGCDDTLALKESGKLITLIQG